MNIKKYMAGVMAAACLMFSSVAFAAPADENINLGTIDVTGTASVEAVPNQGTVRISIENTNKDAKMAASENAKVMHNIQSKLLSLAIPADKIQTVSYSVYPEYINKGNNQVIAGYHANNTIAVVVNDINKISTVVDTALTAGANSIQSIDLGLNNIDQYKNQVLAGALNNAKMQANVAAAALGKKVVGVKHVNVYNNTVSNNLRTIAFASNKMSSDSSEVSTPIQGGTIAVKANVNVTFYIQ